MALGKENNSCRLVFDESELAGGNAAACVTDVGMLCIRLWVGALRNGVIQPFLYHLNRISVSVQLAQPEKNYVKRCRNKDLYSVWATVA